MKLHIFGDRDLPKALLIHPMLLNGTIMYQNFVKFLPKFCYVCPDLSGHGDSTESFTNIYDEANSLSQALLAQNLTEFAFVYAASLGGRVAVELITNPQLKFGLVYCDGAPLYPNAWFKFTLIALATKLTTRYYKSRPHKFKSSLEKFYNHEFAQVMTDSYLNLDTSTMIKMSKACSSFDFYELAEDLQQKLYFAYGEKELNKECINYIQQYYPQAHTMLQPNSNHCEYAVKYEQEFAQEFIFLLKQHNLL